MSTCTSPLLVLLVAGVAHAQCPPMVAVPDNIFPGDAYGGSAAVAGAFALVGAPDATLESGAVFAFTYSGRFAHTQTITPTDADVYDQFGTSINMRAKLAVIGAPLDTVNGFASGSAYVFAREGQQWIEQAKLLAGDGSPYDLYGLAVATDGEFAFVGCPRDDERDINAGAVYIYAPGRDGWQQVQKLTALDAAYADQFGGALDATAGRVIVGARAKSIGEAPSGAAYVFVRKGDTWVQEARLTATEPVPLADFGSAVAIDGSLLAIGAPCDSTGGPCAGAVHIYRCIGGDWAFEATLVAQDAQPDDRFGASVSLDGGSLIVGSRAANEPDGPTGAAYLFRRAIGGVWEQSRRFDAGDPALGAPYFGWAVALDQSTAIVGAPFGDGPFAGTGTAFGFDIVDCACLADLDLDGSLTILDFVALQQGVMTADPSADINGDGVHSILDFVAYQELFATGCD